MTTSSSQARRLQRDGPPSTPLFPAGSRAAFVLVTGLFFLWGVPSNLNDVLIRQFMKSFALSRLQAGLVQSAFYLGYFLMAIPAALLMRRLGYKAGCVLGLLLFGLGACLFWPAAAVGRYGFFLAALFILASGLSCLETASNSFIAQCGDAAGAERRLNLAQAFNPLGAIIGAWAGTVFIFSGVELSPARVRALRLAHQYASYAHSETLRVVRPYVVLGAVAFLWAALIARVSFPETADELASTGALQSSGAPARSWTLLANRAFVLAVLAQFLYVGAQVGTWSYFIQYVQAYAHQPEKIAGYLLTGALVAFGAGRFVSSYLMKFVDAALLMGSYACVNVLLVVFGVIRPGWAGLWALLFSSFFMSLMFPTIFAIGLRGLGAETKLGGSILVMAIAGGAVLTPAMGWISERYSSVALAYLVPAAAYLYIAVFSLARVRTAAEQQMMADAGSIGPFAATRSDRERSSEILIRNQEK